MSERIDIAGEIRRDTPKEQAVLFYDGTREVWLPRSQIKIKEKDGFVLGGRLVEVSLPEWLAKEKGLI
jgi:hypothetical protein